MLNDSLQIGTQGESVGDLLANLASHSAGLVQDEFLLARQEIREKLKLYQSALLLILMGAVFGFLALAALCAAFIIWLGQYMQAWGAAGILGLLLAGAGLVILLIARSEFRHLNLRPEVTLQTLEENKEWLKDMS